MLLRVVVQTLRLISSFLSSFCLRIKILFLSAWLQIHSQVIEFLATYQILRLFFITLKEVVRAMISMDKILPIFVLKF